MWAPVGAGFLMARIIVGRDCKKDIEKIIKSGFLPEIHGRQGCNLAYYSPSSTCERIRLLYSLLISVLE